MTDVVLFDSLSAELSRRLSSPFQRELAAANCSGCGAGGQDAQRPEDGGRAEQPMPAQPGNETGPAGSPRGAIDSVFVEVIAA